MNNEEKNAAQSADELSQLRNRVAALERDLSEALKEKKDPREKETKFQRMVENISDVIFEVDSSGVILYFSPPGKDIWGYDEEDIVGKNFMELVYPDDQEILIKRFVELGAGLEKPSVYRLKNKAGEFKWVRTKTKPRIENGTFIGAIGTLIDITDQKQAEEMLRESEAQYWLLADHMRDAVWLMDMNLKTTYRSPSTYKQRGYTRAEFQELPLDQNLTKASLEVAFAAFSEEMSKALADPTYTAVRTLELEFYCKDGTTILAESTFSLIRDESGKPQYFLCEGRDITERKKIEEALRESEERYRAISESSHNAICIVDDQAKISWANSEMLTASGYSQEQLYAVESFVSFIAPESIEFVVSNYYKVLAGQPYEHHYTFYVIRADGEKRLFEKNMMDFKDKSGKLKLIISMMDITDRRQAEENYRTLFHEMIEGFALHEIICNEEGLPTDYRFLAVNPAFERMTGLKAEQLVGRTVLDVMPETERYWIETYGKVALTGEPAFFENYAVVLGKHFEVTAFQSAPHQFACMFADITDRKRAEEEKSKLEAQLFQSQKMEAIGTLAGGIAHDFNNILAVIIGYTELARDRSQKENKEQYLQETIKGAERARNLVKQILAFSRQDGNEKKPLDIKVMLKEAIKFLRASIPTTIAIDQYITDESCNIMADPTQMHQIIMNLCTNAAHAMKEAGGTLRIELANIELVKDEIPNFPDLEPGHYVKLTISDTGHGIDPVLIKSIFDPFFTTKSVDEGTGLGLSVVYGIVKSHGGVINVNSEQGKGAAFHIHLPRIIQTETKEVDAGKPVIGGTERILFVDDEPSLVDIGMRMLFPLGYHVTGAASSKDALDIFRAKPESFDLVITDMTLPKMTGIDLSREMLKIRPDIPIILCSGVKEQETEAQAKSLGIKAYLTKPLTRRELARVMREVLGSNR